MNYKYYKRLDFIRVFSCLAVLLYHIGILKGGYLAVCTFFVLSGYLSVISSFKKEKFSFKDYYLNRLKKIYLPLLTVVLISISIISFIPSIDWLNLKPETTSIFLGYNNYWQINANLDYFVRHISSPFMHLWYISIVLQFELIFPIIYYIFKNIGDKINKILPSFILGIFGILSYMFFYKTINHGNIMAAYYGTWTRAFSILFGLSLGFVHHYYHPLSFKNKNISKINFILYLLILSIFICFIDDESQWFNLSMLVTTFISIRLIDYGLITHKKNTFVDSIISSLSKISYEIYLVQYPVIFLFQNININFFAKTFLIITLTVILSYIIHASLNIKKKDKFIVLKIIMLILITFIALFGLFKYITTKDYTNDIKKLEEQLNRNSLIIEEKQKQLKETQKNEQEEWEKVLNDLDNAEENLKEMVRNLQIVGIGDSIMELAVNDLYEKFPNGYFDAAVNRTDHQANEILVDLKNKNLLGDVIVFNLGTNGECSMKCKDQIMETIGDRKLYWLNATHPDFPSFNSNLVKLAEKYKNIHIVDWISVSKDHPEYIISDKVHPTKIGCKVYAETIYNTIYEDYLNEFNKQKEKKLKEHEEKEKRKITFIGNELLLGIYDNLQEEYQTSEFIIDKDLSYKSLNNYIESKIKENSLSYNLVFLLDKSLEIEEKEYKKLINLCNQYNIYIIDLYGNIKINKEKVTVISFDEELKNHKNYVSFDGIHLTDEGNLALKEMIKSNLNK